MISAETFLFSDVPPGRYLVSVKEEGYIRQEYGQKTPGGKGSTVVIEAGRRSLNIVFRLQPAATIHGVVGNEDGFTIANILVQAMKRGYDDRGKRTLTVFSSTFT